MSMAPSATNIEQSYVQPYQKEYGTAIQEIAPLSTNGFGYIRNGTDIGRALVKNILKQRVESIDTNACEAGQEDAFFVADMGEVYRQHLRWKLKLRRVKPHYGKY